MDGSSLLLEPFEKNRAHLRTVAYRMLGSEAEAEDAVQETWLRLTRSGATGVENLGGWLTTVVARVCLDMLRSRRTRREDSLDPQGLEPIPSREEGANPEQPTVLADSIGLAMLVILETLPPAERVAFVLHDMFDLPFDEIGPIVGRSPTAARQLASRGRRRVQGAEVEREIDRPRQREIVDAFLTAARGGDMAALLAVLAPDVVLWADSTATKLGAKTAHGQEAVAKLLAGRAQAARLALIDGSAGAIWAVEDKPRAVVNFTIEDGKIVAIDVVGDPERLAQLELAFLDGPSAV